MSQVFVSYKREEKSASFVEHLKAKLEDADFDVWIDQNLLRPGQHWIQEIDKAIKASIALIVVLTPEAHKSLYVTYEWSYALGRGMEVIPLLLEKTEIHRRLQDIQHIDFQNHWNLPWEKLIERLVEIDTGQIRSTKETPPFVQRAVDALDSYELDDRITAVERLTQSNHPAAVEALANAVQHHIVDVRIYAALALAQVTNLKDQRAIPGLVEALSEAESEERNDAALLLGKMLEADSPYFEDLHKLLSHRLETVRVTTIMTLGYARNASSIPIMFETLSKQNEITEFEYNILEKALINVGESAVPYLADFIVRDSQIAQRCIVVLGEIGHKSAVPKLIEVIEKDESSIDKKRYAVEALGKIGDARAIPVLSSVLDNKDKYIQELIGKYTIDQSSPVAKFRLVTFPSSVVNSLMMATTSALEKIGTQEALAILETYRKADDDSD